MRTSVLIFASWFFGSAAVGAGLVTWLNPMAGLSFLIFLVTIISMTIVPIAHIVIRRKGYPIGETISVLIIGIVCAVFVLGFSGWFSFA